LWDAKLYMEGKQFDIIASNPPYIPRPRSIDDNPYEWLSLPIYLIQNIDKILTEKGKLFLNLSSLSLPIMQEFLNSENIIVKQLDSMEVPLKVFNVLNSPERMDYLINEKWLKKEYRDGHEYRQTLYMYEIQRNTSV
jgi:methylase of polypeptide subunit release factors